MTFFEKSVCCQGHSQRGGETFNFFNVNHSVTYNLKILGLAAVFICIVQPLTAAVLPAHAESPAVTAVASQGATYNGAALVSQAELSTSSLPHEYRYDHLTDSQMHAVVVFTETTSAIGLILISGILQLLWATLKFLLKPTKKPGNPAASITDIGLSVADTR